MKHLCIHIKVCKKKSCVSKKGVFNCTQLFQIPLYRIKISRPLCVPFTMRLVYLPFGFSATSGHVQSVWLLLPDFDISVAASQYYYHPVLSERLAFFPNLFIFGAASSSLLRYYQLTAMALVSLLDIILHPCYLRFVYRLWLCFLVIFFCCLP